MDNPSRFNKALYVLTLIALVVLYLDIAVWRP